MIEQLLLEALRQVSDPASGRDLPASGRIDSLGERDGVVHLAIRAARDEQDAMEAVRTQAEAALARVAGVRQATAILTAHRPARPAPSTPPPPPSPPAHAPIRTGTAPAAKAPLLAGVGAVIAVASGKGGVGKSTTAVNLAIGLQRLGLAVGLLDADIHGPSLPRMLGVTTKPEVRDGLMLPIEAWGLRTMSIGFLVEERTAMIWRGPMVMGALGQLMGEVDWGALDVLVVDMPPGTGDAQLTMAQKVSLAGAVIVSTPQDIALLDARRGVAMFEKTRVPVLGIVENMSHFTCPHCGTRTDLFGHGGARLEASLLGVPFLGEIPLLLEIRTSADAGTPVMAAAPDSPAGRAYAAVAERVRALLRFR
ncbi:P-loop NTPase [Lichenicoccus sp.]|uniref:Mrp/NBP35 family ATP-binding protein n=1 Tax=Lichenicoccus sp. TaxID=2781899 RepID=UPI003D151FC2